MNHTRTLVASISASLFGLCALAVSTTAPAQHYADPSLPRIIPQLSRMAPEQLRALIADEGLEVCTSLASDESQISSRQRCESRTREQLTDAELGRITRQWAFGGRGLQHSSVVCRHTAEGERCRASVEGPQGMFWFFRGTGETRRLIRVVNWSLTE